jgi:hypothetical protein
MKSEIGTLYRADGGASWDLRLSDGLWAKLHLSDQGSDGTPYSITSGSQLIGRPMWAGGMRV